MSLKDKVVIVTGSGQGIGRGYAVGFAERGARVVVADVNEEKARCVVSELTECGHDALAVKVDISSEDEVAAMTSAVVDAYGRVDVLVNNAALFATIQFKPYTDITVDEWDLVFRVNTRGTFLCNREIGKLMKEQRSGRIINISSGVVDDGRPNYLHYLSSKSAINGMTRGLASELGDFGVAVNTISPYGIMTEVPRIGVTEEAREKTVAAQAIHVKGSVESVVGTALYLADDELSGFVTGQTIHVNGGTIYH